MRKEGNWATLREGRGAGERRDRGGKEIGKNVKSEKGGNRRRGKEREEGKRQDEERGRDGQKEEEGMGQEDTDRKRMPGRGEEKEEEKRREREQKEWRGSSYRSLRSIVHSVDTSGL